MQFNIQEIIKMIPHSYPFLLIDKVIACTPNESATAVKNVTFNEPFFIGHFPGNPIMPGVLIVEAMAQACMVCVISEAEENIHDYSVYFMSIELAKFRKPVIPGDTLIIEVNVIHRRKNTCKFQCHAQVDNILVAEAQILAMIKQNEA
ncbi:3-hydroxyacyl-[acyl-carrier-protein] dehydratase FabZ [Ehrlichia minasensis]|uniref:3-hydroxyacyl-[acyl-carrier-protein] dehydratase FabZ n=1 Tax=Ehrlichia minasensis TaxID=1242993 RepID=A0A4Q6I9G0_9RICK|nr:3-hydroxyacyl-ACP dehydratase FabZ [Ehrlichia minasensis]RZB12657.1 3-hydroxyacyl-[acyl-carrier-protein] dehydratase FabZ [Ehrlichia minasensis]CEI84744.1 3-hydroxyacyl-[acyl-carrier-protein] dehydratase FabZ ((3R)-hydroxymyristoyl-[acyl-carrier-pro tein] dehydratase) ((3R)-hydroxymyristoyl-ACP dehydrase) (B eta-hydroxyacyl-ACP dehydratase) [Ehrlichia minasensis]